MKDVKISIITVCFNAELTVEKTILSVIKQTYDPIEFIVVDGGSSDMTMNIISKYKDNISIVLSEPDNGIFDAMNKGIDLCTGDYCLFLNCGDYFYSNDSIKEAVTFFNSDSAVIYGNTEYRFDYGSEILAPQALERVMTGAFCCHQSAFFRIDIIRKYKYDLSYRIISDWVLFRNLYIDQCKFQYIDTTIASYDNTEGLSTANGVSSYIKHQKEKARCMKIGNKLSWKCQLACTSLCFIIRRYLIRFIPNPIYKKMKKYWIHIHIHK